MGRVKWVSRPSVRESSRRFWAGLGAAALAVVPITAAGAFVAAPAQAVPDLTLTFSQETGLGNFDVVVPGTAPAPGQDPGPDDDIIRTNDVVVYQFAAGTPQGAAEGVTAPVVTIQLPQGEQFVNLVGGKPSFTNTKGAYNVVPPAFCLPGSTITYSTGATTMPAPNVQSLSATSYTALPQQTLTCYLPDIAPGEGVGLTLYSTVRPEVPHGTVLGPVSMTIDGSYMDPATTQSASHTVTSASKWDLSFNGSQVSPDRDNTDFVKQNTQQMCTHNYGGGSGALAGTPTGLAGQLCYVGGFSVTLAQTDGGLGGTPIQGGIFSYTIDLSPETIWNMPAYEGGQPTGLSIYETVQAHNAAAPADQQIELPGGYATSNFGGTGWVFQSANSNLLQAPETATTISNSVRSSGTTTLGTYTPASSATYNVTGADTTAYTVPDVAGQPANSPLWSERGYVYTSRVFVEVPITVLEQNFAFFDALDAGGENGSLEVLIRFDQDQSALAYTAVPGLSPVETNSFADVDGSDNNYRIMRTGFVNAIAVRNQWFSPFATGDDRSTSTITEGPSTATSPVRYWSGNPAAYGPSGETAIYKGDGVAVDGEIVLSSLILEGGTYTGGGTLMCQSFDNREVVVDPAAALAVPSGNLQM